jgi:hypothetical protein
MAELVATSFSANTRALGSCLAQAKALSSAENASNLPLYHSNMELGSAALGKSKLHAQQQHVLLLFGSSGTGGSVQAT